MPCPRPNARPVILAPAYRLALISVGVLGVLFGMGCVDRSPPPETECNNNIDDDGDGDRDCQDSDCAAVCPAGCEPSADCPEWCDDGIDNDLNGLVDCEDSACDYSWLCREDCNNGLDDDANGAVDCEDYACAPNPPCVEICNEDIDANLNGLSGCEDPECWDSRWCPEYCENARDDDFDGATDCEDDECWCPLEAGEFLCSDGYDNDFNGVTDCEGPGCAATDFCSCSGVHRGGVCLAEPAEGTVSPPFSYVRSFGVPAPDSEARCCFDFDDDRNVDNAYARAFESVPGRDPENNLRAALDRGELQTLIAWGPDDEFVHLIQATNDLDGDGEADQTYAEREDGEGVFAIVEGSLDSHGPESQFNLASGANLYSAGDLGIVLNLPLPILPGLIELRIRRAQIRLPYVENETGRWSTETTWRIDDEERTYGDVELGGIILLDDVAAVAEVALRRCECPGFAPNEPMLVAEERATSYWLACNQVPGAACIREIPECEISFQLCTTLPFISNVADIDTNGNGVADAMSIGLRLSVVPATLAE